MKDDSSDSSRESRLYAEISQRHGSSNALCDQYLDQFPRRLFSQREQGSFAFDALPRMDIDTLRTRYRQLYRKAAPAHMPRWLLVRILAYRMQALAHTDLDAETIRILERIARDQARLMAAENRNGAASGVKRSRAAILENSVAAVPYRLRPGTQLVREHGGELHRVIVLENGYSWNSSTYTSLSEIARTITGTSWNGPVFFGLRSKKAQSGPSGSDTPMASIASP